MNRIVQQQSFQNICSGNFSPGIFFGSLLRSLLMTCLMICCLGCAYHFGAHERSLPNAYRQVTIPLFKNSSMEPGIEVAFTNALVKEFERSRVGRVVEPSQAEVTVEGTIKAINYRGVGPQNSGLPSGSLLATTYDIEVVASVIVKRRSDLSVLWSGEFARTRSYGAPQVTLPGLNTVNPLYNLSARRQNLDILAVDMMVEAHDRLTENF